MTSESDAALADAFVRTHDFSGNEFFNAPAMEP